jgi:RHS repeat-associated protein
MDADSEVTHFMWLDQVLLAELDEQGSPIRRYIPAERLDRVSIINQDGENFFVADDPMGTVHRLVAADGTVVARYDYDPWGKLLYSEGPLAQAPRRFFGAMQVDAAGGLIYLRNRWYDPEVGQFISVDPYSELTAYPNPTMYARNNPVYFCDQEGLCPDPGSTMFNVARDGVITGSQFLGGRAGPIGGVVGNVFVLAKGLKGADGTVRGNARAGMKNFAAITGFENSPQMRGIMNSFMDFAENGTSISARNRSIRNSRSNCDPTSSGSSAGPRDPVFKPCP